MVRSGSNNQPIATGSGTVLRRYWKRWIREVDGAIPRTDAQIEVWTLPRQSGTPARWGRARFVLIGALLAVIDACRETLA